MDTDTIIIFVVLLTILIILSALFSSAETAYSSIQRGKLELWTKSGSRASKLVKKHYKSFGWTLSTILICNNFINISASSIITLLFTKLMGASSTVSIVSTFVMTPIIVIFGEIAPKILAKKFALGYLKKVVYIMEFFNWLFIPLTYPLSKISLSTRVTNTEEELGNLLSIAREERVLQQDEAALAIRALELDSKKIGSFMVKKSSIVSIGSHATVSTAKKTFSKTGFSRLPVLKNSSFSGVLLLKDIILADDNEQIGKYVIPAPTISKNTIATKALEYMRIEQLHIAFISTSNDSKKIIGMITIEDIFEELVGEIYDEHDSVTHINEISHFKWMSNGSVTMAEISKAINYNFKDVDPEQTLKQWIQSRINRVIRKDLEYTYKRKIRFRIVSNKNNEDTKIEIFKKI